MEYQRISRTCVYHGAILDVYQDRMRMSNGHEADWDFIDHKGAAAIVAQDEDGKLLMVRQYRNTMDGYTIEIPAGGRNPGESMAECAARELEEETGFRTEKVEFLVDFVATIAYSNEKIGIYWTDRLIPSKQHLDEDEDVEVLRYSLEELTDMILEGTIVDGKTIAAIMAYQIKKQRMESGK